MISNKEIYRNPNNFVNESHFVYFDAETIEKIRDKFHTKHYDNNVNINHNGIKVNRAKLTKSFILKDEYRSTLPDSLNDLPNGTWIIKYEIENEEIWKQIKDQKLNGFSVEGIFNYENL